MVKARLSFPRGSITRAAVSLGLIFATSTTFVGCRITEDDIHRWEVKQHGPEKLEAVLFYPKYDDALRVEAALSLIRMKPRGYTDPFDGESNGDGIEGMVKTLARIPAEKRTAIVGSLVPAIITELKKPPPVQQGDQKPPPDPSFAFKDAAYAMLTYDKTSLISDDLRASLSQALVDWAMADFETRLENRTQKYGMDQLVRHIGSDAVAGLPKLMTRDARNLDKMASLVAELGAPATKEEASKQLAGIAAFIISDEWIKVKTPILQEANKQGKIQFDPDPKKADLQFKNQLESYQDEDLIRVLGSMKKVGGRASIDWELTFAADAKQKKERRQAALAALEGKLDVKAHPEDVDRIMAIVKVPDAPGEVLDQAFRRISELPREKVLEKLYGLFATDKWKIRRLAAVVTLKMLNVKDLDTFMSKLPEKDNGKGFAMAEAITDSANMKDLKEGNVLDVIKKYSAAGTPAQRTTALSYYYSYGEKADIEKLAPFEADKSPAPSCDTDEECKWICVVPSEAADKPDAEGNGPELSIFGNWLGGTQKEFLEKALKEVGVPDVELKPKEGNKDVLTGKGKLGKNAVTISLVPYIAPPKPPEPLKAADIAALDANGTAKKVGGVVLAIEGKDKKATADLFAAIEKQRDVAGVGLSNATKEILEKALKESGYTDYELKPKGDSKDVLTAKVKKDGTEFTITFVPYVAPPKAPDPPFKPADLAALETAGAAVRRAGSVILIIESSDKQVAADLAADLVKKKKDIKQLGEYVKFCVEPAITDRLKAAAKPK
jgi:hypothetical protein